METLGTCLEDEIGETSTLLFVQDAARPRALLVIRIRKGNSHLGSSYEIRKISCAIHYSIRIRNSRTEINRQDVYLSDNAK